MGYETRANHPWQGDQNAKAMSAWEADGEVWRHAYEARVQHTFSRMNHHIHPLNEETGERRVLESCRPTNSKENICKSGFPPDKEIAEKTTSNMFLPREKPRAPSSRT